MTHTAVILGNHTDESQTHDALATAGFDVVLLQPDTHASDIRKISTPAPVLLIVDADVAQGTLVEVFDAFTAHGCQIVLVGGHSSQTRFSSQITQGRAMYVRRPFDGRYLIELFKDIFEDAEATQRKGKRKQQVIAMDQFGSIYGSCTPMRDMYRFLRKAARSESVLCIHGESGTGKELVAQAVHAYSMHHRSPYEAINCAAIPADLVESELFGHEKGSFSGAVAEHIGIFERVGKGTLLLDEIAEMPHTIQVKLLRVLESGRFRRVGGEVDHSYKARVITATNCKPLEAVQQGKLREDLFYRISQLEVRVPPLRERGQDIVALSRLFVDRFNEENDRRVRLTKKAEDALLLPDWPGNVRQLWNVIQKACTAAREKIDIDDLPLEPSVTARSAQADACITLPIAAPLQETEEAVIKACLELYSGDKQRTAEELGISLRTLYARLEKYRHQQSA